MATKFEKEDFARDMFGSDKLDEAIEWIKKNMTPDAVFDDSDLETWAEEHGYVKDDES